MSKSCICYITWNRFAYTKKSLDSILKNTKREDYDCVIWDNGSEDEGMIDWIRNTCLDNGFYYLFFRRNEGLTKAMNNEMSIMDKMGKYDVFCHIANDIVVPPNWLEAVFKCVESKKVGAVGLNLEFDNTFEKVEINGVELQKIRQEGNVGGAHYCIPKWIYEILGGFQDVHAGYGQQDANYSLQIKLLSKVIDVWDYYLSLDHYKGEDLGKTGVTYDVYQRNIEERLRRTGSDPWGGRNYREHLRWQGRHFENGKYTKEQLIDNIKTKDFLKLDKTQLCETNISTEFIN